MYLKTKRTVFTATPDKYPQKFFKDKPCRKCGTLFQPQAPSHLYCSSECFDYTQMNNYLMRTYKITHEDYYSKLKDQNDVCKICEKEGFVMSEHHKLKLVVDHDHSTGEVRGLLCHNCNRALGLMKDDVKIIESGLKYLLTNCQKSV